MKPRMLLVVAVFVSSSLSGQVSAQGLISWAPGYPKDILLGQKIAIQGIVTLDKGWKIVGNSVRVVFWEDGSNFKKFTVPLRKDEKTWGEASFGLTPGALYNVIVEVRVTDGKEWATLCTEPKTALIK